MSSKNNLAELLANPPTIYYTSWQEIAFVGRSMDGIIYTVQENFWRRCWEQVKYSPDGIELVRAQITNGSPMNYREMYLFAQHCPGGEFYDRLRLATRADFNGKVK